jgi:superfamily I DNA/RNA helicase/CRISPR/Cas system-associated exonuclease Cas4 (RecB family)
VNHWDVVRLQAREKHAAALKLSGGDSAAEALLTAAASLTGIPRQGLPAGHPLLYKAQAVLDTDYVWFNQDVATWQAQFNQAHEYGHHWRHGEDAVCFEADIDLAASEDAIALGIDRVDGYGPHERRELEANLFAREFFLPGDKLRAWYLAGENANDIADKTGMPIYMVIHQLTRALLGPELVEPNGHILLESSTIELDSSQREAAQAGEEESARGEREPPILVDAGPGTGKTRTLVARAQHLLTDRHIPPSQILALTYSNKAAEEMYSRVSATAMQNAGRLWIGTFHKFGLDLIRQYHDRLGLSPKPVVIDTLDAQLLLEQSLARLGLNHYRSLPYPEANLRAILDAISRAKDELVSPAEYADYVAEELIKAAKADDKKAERLAEKKLEVAGVYSVYEELLAEKDYLDYGDLLLRAVRLLQENDDVRWELQNKYRHILVDEYQDINTASRLLLKILADDGDGLWVVGDLRQAIYRFRGAAPINMRLLTTEDYTDAKIIPLKTNYRSRQAIVNVSAVCAKGMRATQGRKAETWEVNRKDGEGEIRFKVSADEHNEALDLVEEVKRLHSEGIGYRDQAVLCRRHDDLAHFSNALEQAGIPVLYLGNFIERPEIRDLLSLISLATEVDGSAIFRIAQFDEYGFSFKDAQPLIAHVYEHGCRFPATLQCVDEVEGISDEGKIKLGLLAEHFSDFDFGTTAWKLLADYLFLKSNYLRPLISDQSVQAQQKRLAIYQFLLFAYQMRDRFINEGGDQKRRFLNYVRRIKLNNEEKQLCQTPDWADDIDAVRMLTVHAAKGLEFGAVHLMTLSDGKFPLRNYPSKCQPPEGMLREEMLNWHGEEEECLFFVGLSRARDNLCLYRARQYKTKKDAPASPLLKLVQEVLPRAIAKFPVRPALREKKVAQLTLPETPQEFHEKELATYLDCPLKYYYRYVLKISDKRSDNAFAQTRLCVQRAWQEVDKEFDAGREVTQQWVTDLLKQIWEIRGPKGHAYEADYLKEAEAIIHQTFIYRSSAEDRILRPKWKVEMESGVVVIRPSYVEFTEADTGISIIVKHLHLGKPPEDGPSENYYALSDLAAERAFPGANRRIQAMYMSTDETVDVNVPYGWRKDKLKRYEDAMRGILLRDFEEKPKIRTCPYCPCYCICNSMESVW